MGQVLVPHEHSKPAKVRQSQTLFLNALKQTGTSIAACRLLGIEPHTPSRWLAKYPKFKELYEQAKAHAEQYIIKDRIEENFYSRAVAGKEDGQSAIIGMFTLKRIDPRYRENGGGINVNMTGPVSIVFGIDTTTNSGKQDENTIDVG